MLTPNINIGASVSFHAKQRYGKSKMKKTGFMPYKSKPPWRGNFTECKHCHVQHGENEMCENNPEYKKFAQRHIREVGTRNKRYTPRQKCWCCHTIGHICSACPCRQTRQVANFSCDNESDDSYESYETTDSETMHDEIPKGNACCVSGIDDIQQCNICKVFHESSKLYCGHVIPMSVADGNALRSMNGKLQIVAGFVNNVKVSVLRDTGSTLIGVQKNLVRPKDFTGEHIICRTFGGEQQKYPVAWVKIHTPYLTARVKAAVLQNPCTELIIGNVPNVTEVNDQAVTQHKMNTDNNKQSDITKQQVIPPQETQHDNTSLPMIQKQDVSLEKCWEIVTKPDKVTKYATSKFMVLRKILYRIHQVGNHITKQVVLPVQERQKVFELGHASAFGGHMGIQKTLSRIQQNFYWPDINNEVKKKCKSCAECQITRPEGKFPKATLQVTDIPSRPFEKVAIDIIGPMSVPSERGNLYILTLVDLCTRWPEAIPLRTITSEAVAEALLLIFSRVGFPNTILSDNGPQFVSQATKLVMNKLGIKQVFATPYHPQTNGTCERFNGTLKSMLGKVAFNNPSTWDTLLPAVLFAYREVPQDSTKFSPFEMLYGANPRGPLSIYREMLVNQDLSLEKRSTYELVTDIRDKVLKACELAKKNTDVAHTKHRNYKNVNKKTVTFHKDDLVMLLLPKKTDKLLIEWQGPYKVLSKISDVDYKISVNGKEKVFHVNMMGKYHENSTIKAAVTNNVIVIHEGVIEDTTHGTESEDNRFFANTIVNDSEDQDEMLDIVEPLTQSKTSYKDVKVCSLLTTDQRKEIDNLLKKYKEIFSDVPGKSKSTMHHIRLTTDIPVKTRPYVIPEHYRERVESEIRELESLKIIQRFTSNYSSSMVVIKKKDDSLRICIDYRKLNSITVTDAEPIPGVDELITSMSMSNIFSKLDLTKGYYQIPLTAESKHLTAFSTTLGLYEFNYMPFSLVNAPATFVRMMRSLLKGISNVVSYIDDVCMFNNNFEQHVILLEKVFQRERENGLTVKPVKIEIAFPEVSFLGHSIKQGIITTDESIVSKILKIEPPRTKKHVQSLLGLINYYAKFIPHFANKTAVLSFLLKKENKKLIWTSQCQQVLDELKQLFSTSPILKIPDFKQTFIIQTDASNVAIAGCLGQYYNGTLHTCLYVSRKLNSAERNYATVELEALAVVYTVSKCKKYLLGKPFIVQSDNQPLKVITAGMPKNARIARWALLLQDYTFTVSHIEGKNNCLADLLSRL
ncbi:hypothetical protein BsWGS_06190 [Bradybaena similaris]